MCGIDWSERHHDVAIVDERTQLLAQTRISDDLAGFRRLTELLAEHAPEAEPSTVEVAIETDKGLLVAALTVAGMQVYAINPRAVARYRERYGQAGGKSDPGDAVVLANILRTDRHQHRSIPAMSQTASAVKVLAPQHQQAIWARQHPVNRLPTLLVECYPN